MKFSCALLLHMEFIIYVYFYLFFLNTPLSLEINSLHLIFFFNANQYFLIFKYLLQMKSVKKKAVERNYDCVICMDLCKKPISCLRCHQLICYHHVKLLADKCPHCRLEPFQYQDEPMIQSYIHIQITKKREALKKEHVFKCLVEQCNFQGKYPTMVFHKKSKHPYQKIDQILFPEERQKKKMREAIKRIFLQKYVDKAKKYTEQALVFYIKGKGVVGMKQLTKMVAHINNCNHEQCKTVIYAQNYASIGIKNEDQVIESHCPYVNQFRVDI